MLVTRFSEDGTTEKSQIYPGPRQGNFNGDETVDIDDLITFTDARMIEPVGWHWNSTRDISISDDDTIDLEDFEMLARNWQKGLGPKNNNRNLKGSDYDARADRTNAGAVKENFEAS